MKLLKAVLWDIVITEAAVQITRQVSDRVYCQVSDKIYWQVRRPVYRQVNRPVGDEIEGELK